MKAKKISIIGMPLDLGQERRGVDMGPSAIRYANLQDQLIELGYQVKDLGDLPVSSPESMEIYNPRLKYLPEVKQANEQLAKTVKQELSEGYFPLILGGDHSLAIGSIAGVSNQIQNLGVIWIDAHADCNTAQTTPSGNIHGMSLAVALGEGNEELIHLIHSAPKIKPEHLVIIGARELDPGEQRRIQALGVKVYTMHDIDRGGMATVMEEAIQVVSQGTEGVHLSFDLDSLDPKDAPGVGTPVPGGITYREGHLAMEMLSEADILVSAEFVEVNPILDHSNQTAKVAVQLAGSVFGKTVLPNR